MLYLFQWHINYVIINYINLFNYFSKICYLIIFSKIILLMKKLLNIDGGGVKVYLTLHVLKYIEKKTNKKIIDLFDFFSGVSVSSLILSFLLLSYSVDELIIFIKKMSRNIFYRSNFYTLVSAFGILRSKYLDSNIDTELKNFLDNKKFSEIDKPLLILTYDLNSNKPIYYKNYEDINNDIPLWKIIRGSISAPSYFKPFALDDKILIDGGIVSNNLSDLIINEAINYYDENEIFYQLSLGTGLYLPKNKRSPSGLLYWSNLILDTIFNASSEYQLDLLKNQNKIDNLKYFHRLNFILDEPIELDDYTAFDKMDLIFNKWLDNNSTILDKICDELLSI